VEAARADVVRRPSGRSPPSTRRGEGAFAPPPTDVPFLRRCRPRTNLVLSALGGAVELPRLSVNAVGALDRFGSSNRNRLLHFPVRRRRRTGSQASSSARHWKEDYADGAWSDSYACNVYARMQPSSSSNEDEDVDVCTASDSDSDFTSAHSSGGESP